MFKTEEYRQALHTWMDWESCLMENSGLPGPRGDQDMDLLLSEMREYPKKNRLIKMHDAWVKQSVKKLD